MAAKTKGMRLPGIEDAIPEAQWSDVRREYLVEGKSFAQIARERCCDERTVARLVKENLCFADVGKKLTPSKTEGFQDLIEELLKSGDYQDDDQITLLSARILSILQGEGFCGSERTLREYLKTLPWRTWIVGENERNEEESL